MDGLPHIACLEFRAGCSDYKITAIKSKNNGESNIGSELPRRSQSLVLFLASRRLKKETLYSPPKPLLLTAKKNRGCLKICRLILNMLPYVTSSPLTPGSIDACAAVALQPELKASGTGAVKAWESTSSSDMLCPEVVLWVSVQQTPQGDHQHWTQGALPAPHGLLPVGYPVCPLTPTFSFHFICFSEINKYQSWHWPIFQLF